ncbi:MAG: hypothetical protein K2W95_12150 [Candidatus Obscuribacterales bacterium]|nr:hypothetical protein [Candidatus Obscuribacterales bacterium]
MIPVECVTSKRSQYIEPAAGSLLDGADATLRLQDEYGAVSAQCSLWWSDTPLVDGRRSGYVGHFEASSASAGSRLLLLACRRLSLQGCDVAIGPIDGSTWKKYRLVTDAGEEAPFFLEPKNPSTYPSMFASSGFSVLAKYFSTSTAASSRPAELARYRNRLDSRGVTVRSLDLDRVDEELKSFYEISTASFAPNFLYQEIGAAEFVAMYKPLIPILDPRLVLVAEVKERPVGFMLFVPNVLDGSLGKRSVIAKTAARLPGKSLAGLGSLLLLQAEQLSAELGYEKVIHALMHEQNASLNICSRYGKVVREYALFYKRI